MKKNRKFYAIPPNIVQMTDEEIEAWAKAVYRNFTKGETGEIAEATETQIDKKNGGKK